MRNASKENNFFGFYRIKWSNIKTRIAKYYRKILWKIPPLRKIQMLHIKIAELELQCKQLIKPICTSQNHFSLETETKGNISINEIAGFLNWPEILNHGERTNGFSELARIDSLLANTQSRVDQPSYCWSLLATKNYDQLLTYGYNNFKRTIANNYFNFLVQKGDFQINSVEKLLKPDVVDSCKKAAATIPYDPTFHLKDQFIYYYFVFMLWEFAKSIDKENYINIFEEPDEGNPITVHAGGKKISQDLANSIIEYYSMSEGVNFKNIKSVLEIGGGYGRNAFVILKINPRAKVTLVDISPALYIAQRYLSGIFKDYKIFTVRNFDTYDEVRDEMEKASIIFLMPHQLSLIPDKQFDLTFNISSFGEMLQSQLIWYFDQMNRLTRQYFYMKQWNISKNPFDGIVLSKESYPYPANWHEIYTRPCSVQTEFFETMYRV